MLFIYTTAMVQIMISRLIFHNSQISDNICHALVPTPVPPNPNSKPRAVPNQKVQLQITNSSPTQTDKIINKLASKINILSSKVC